MASDKLVPVSRTTLQARSVFVFGVKPVPYLAYATSMAMGRLVDDYLSQNPVAPRLHRRLTCESSDAILAYVLKGLGVAWLPWSVVQAHCKAGGLTVIGDKRNEIHFEIRIYRPKGRLSPLAERVWQAIGTY
jgi:DNA-binding transcriptional LysR family regulator